MKNMIILLLALSLPNLILSCTTSGTIVQIGGHPGVAFTDGSETFPIYAGNPKNIDSGSSYVAGYLYVFFTEDTIYLNIVNDVHYQDQSGQIKIWISQTNITERVPPGSSQYTQFTVAPGIDGTSYWFKACRSSFAATRDNL